MAAIVGHGQFRASRPSCIASNTPLTRVKAQIPCSAKLHSMDASTLRMLFLVPLICASAANAAGPWRASDRNTSGWAFMTPKERIEHQATVRAFTDYGACHAFQLRHHQAMQARAQASGETLKASQRDICEHLPQAASPSLVPTQ
jgi:hypothetical protein